MNYKTAQEAKDAFTAQAGDDFIEFEGQNCNDYLDDDAEECSGWQVGERRCDCGNRRVSLCTDGNETNGFYAYASAY
jgi:hypothetical protein